MRVLLFAPVCLVFWLLLLIFLQQRRQFSSLQPPLFLLLQFEQELALVLVEKNKLLTSLSSSMKSTRMGAMASSLAHEINQPLSAIRLNAEMVQSEIAAKPNMNLVHTNLKYLIEDVDRIDGIVNKIKKFFYNDYSDFKNVQLSDLVDSTFDYVQEGCNESNIDLLVNIDPQLRIFGDKGQLQMVVFNLISNAIKFSPAGAAVEISVLSSGAQLLLNVRDFGPGIPENEREQVFNTFIQGSLTKTGAGGTGLGLVICKRIVDNLLVLILTLWIMCRKKFGIIAIKLLKSFKTSSPLMMI